MLHGARGALLVPQLGRRVCTVADGWLSQLPGRCVRVRVLPGSGELPNMHSREARCAPFLCSVVLVGCSRRTTGDGNLGAGMEPWSGHADTDSSCLRVLLVLPPAAKLIADTAIMGPLYVVAFYAWGCALIDGSGVEGFKKKITKVAGVGVAAVAVTGMGLTNSPHVLGERRLQRTGSRGSISKQLRCCAGS